MECNFLPILKNYDSRCLRCMYQVYIKCVSTELLILATHHPKRASCNLFLLPSLRVLIGVFSVSRNVTRCKPNMSLSVNDCGSFQVAVGQRCQQSAIFNTRVEYTMHTGIDIQCIQDWI